MSAITLNANPTPQLKGVIQQAARSTGTSFEYLMTTAQIESNLNPSAQAPTSSARGLYQFIDQTWLATMKQDGPALGFGRYASAIVQDADGHYDIPDPAMRNAVMKLRSNPAVSAAMAGAFARSNTAQLTASLGRAPTEGELYIAHFLGPDGAEKLISTAAKSPRTAAASLFPSAAAANRSVFYDRYGRARDARDVYSVLTGRFAVARATGATATLRGTIPANSAFVRLPVNDTAGVTNAYAEANAGADSDAPVLPDNRPLFQAMFSDRRRLGVTPVVSELWAPAKPDAAVPAPPPKQMDLFTDGKQDARRLFGAGDT
ncbi:MAG TPA: transglycosylase SLT domain-containing protein [Pseudolabrys sp.]|jgi:hypothetical protein|nr:transglycosylase SLT domain-containing protein [Pseudolabrys sp.]